MKDGDCPVVINSILLIQLLLILVEDIVTSVLKKNYDENWTCDIYLNVYVYDEFWARNVKKVKFWIFQAQPASVRVISSIFCM